MQDEQDKVVQEPVKDVIPEVTPPEDKTKVPAPATEIVKELDGIKKSLAKFQSEKDKAIQDSVAIQRQLAETMRKLRAAETTIQEMSREYADDPGFGEKLGNLQTKSKLSIYEDREKEEQGKAEAERKQREFVADLAADIEDLGVDPYDKRLAEAAKGARDNRDLRRRLLKEAANIAKGGNLKESSHLDALQAEIDNLKKKLAAEANEALPPTSMGGKRIYTKKEIKSMPSNEYAKARSDIAAARNEGRIK